jgi:ATP-dependent Clp protease, protease subunit
MNTAIYRWKCALLRILYARISFCAGQIWAFESPEESRTARLVVYRVDPDDRHGEIVSVVPFGVWVPKLTNTQGEHALFVMTRSALRQSVTKLISRSVPLPDVEGEYRYFMEEYRSGRVGLFSKRLQSSLGFYRQLEQAKHGQALPYSDSSTDTMPTDDHLLENREIVLCGVIDDTLANAVVMKLLYLQDQDHHAPITLHIESPGGSVSAGLAIVDTIDMITPPVRTCCHRLAGAMAAIIAAHGEKGHRLAGSDSKLSLNASYASYVAENATVQRGEVAKTNRILAEFVAKDAGRTLEEVALTMNSDVYFSAIQAKEFGLIDMIGRCRTLTDG